MNTMTEHNDLCDHWSARKTEAHTNLIALLVPCHHAHSLDEGMPGVVHTSLNALVQGPAVRGQLVPQLAIDSWGQGTCHTVVVLPQVREVRAIKQSIFSQLKSLNQKLNI